jgi:hypothetical protein
MCVLVRVIDFHFVNITSWYGETECVRERNRESDSCHTYLSETEEREREREGGRGKRGERETKSGYCRRHL